MKCDAPGYVTQRTRGMSSNCGATARSCAVSNSPLIRSVGALILWRNGVLSQSFNEPAHNQGLGPMLREA